MISNPSLLSQGNRALRDKHYQHAIDLYIQALQQTPDLGKIIAPNIERAKLRYRDERSAIQRQRVAVCGWDLAHNAAGRVYTLATLYETFAEVEIIGSLFPSFGREIWEPIRDTPIAKHTFIVEDESKFLEQAIQLVAAHPYDIVHLSKPRVPNIFFGILYKLFWDAKVLMDIDDEELAFVGEETPISIDDYIKQHGKLPELKHLAGKDWTRLAVGLAKEFDGVTVCNVALQERYGGEIIRHARDEKLFKPSPELKRKSRNKYGIPQDKKVVLFFGTPREHKGLIETAQAIAGLKRTDVIFCIAGAFADEKLKQRLLAVEGCNFLFLPNQPIRATPEILSIADCCVMLQDAKSIAAQYQTPAKLSDALGMGIIVIAHSTISLENLAKEGGIISVDKSTVCDVLAKVLRDEPLLKIINDKDHNLFMSEFSFSANSRRLKPLTQVALKIKADAVAMKLASLHTVFGTDIDFTSLKPLNKKRNLSNLLARTQPKDNKLQPENSTSLSCAWKPTQAKIPITVLVITWDVGHNPLGRSYMLAEVLDRVVRNVVILGFQFPRYGDDIWEPVRHGRLPVISLPGENLPELLNSLDRISQRMRPDIVIACKPRLPSIQLGAMIKQKFGCPLIVDIDDHELSFFKNASVLTSEELAKMPDGVASEQIEPYGEIWTRLAQDMCKYADERIVSNVALYREFGGTIVPHVRDEHTFDPVLYDKTASRIKYRVPARAKIVLFFGTPRHHKGVDVLADAVGRIEDDAFRLVIVGSTTDRSVTAKINSLAPGRVIYLPNQPFSAIPEIIMMADVICLPQDENSPISQFQLPAKAIDAVAMGIPLLVACTPPLKQLVQDGVAKPIDLATLPEMLTQAVADNHEAETGQCEIRKRFLARYSYGAAAKQLRELIERALRTSQRTSIDDFPSLLAHERRVLGVKNVPVEMPRSPGIDIVVFWKQNDTGLYGRRSDMVIKYLASRPDVRRVVVFDAPISEFDLLKRRDMYGQITQDRLIYIKTYEKIFGKLDTDKISFNVFVYPPGTYRSGNDGTTRPLLIDAYKDYIDSVFMREGVRSDESVFWIYPKNFMAPELIDRFSPAKVVVDVVDDHRAWPGVTAEERERLTDNYRVTLARAHMAFVNCEPVLKAMSVFRSDIRLVPNGCDPAPIVLKPKNNPVFERFTAHVGPTIGFIGNLEAKIDIPLIENIARAYPQAQVALLGSTHANPAACRLAELSNVLMPGIVPYDEIGAWLQNFDVGIIPHRDMEMTRSMNPLKLYVYLSAEIPVVSTAVENVDDSLNSVYIAKDHQDFISLIGRVLSSTNVGVLGVDAYVNDNSWKRRFDWHVDELFCSLKSG